MKGYFVAGTGGLLAFGDQIVAEIDLPAGRYLVFGKATVAIASFAPKGASGSSLTVSYGACLISGHAPVEDVPTVVPNKDDMIGGLRYDSDDPGSRYEQIALQIAVDSSSSTNVTLRCFPTIPDALLVWGPRISAIQVDELQVMTSSGPHLEPAQGFSLAFLTSYHASTRYVMRDDDD